jgi:glyoxylase-like metal-dependent hydrolase (beta-lactamase superfamily II)
MSTGLRVQPVGEAVVRVFTIYELSFHLAKAFNVPESVWRPDYAQYFEHPLMFPTQGIHISLPGMSLLIDAPIYDLTPDSPFYLPNAQPLPGLVEQLAEQGIAPEDVTHVVITHTHFDHINGATIEQEGHLTPRFPNARYYLGRADWEDASNQRKLLQPDSLFSRTMGALKKQGVLELVEQVTELVPGVTIIPAPGESKGHQIVRVHSTGQTLYCVGDLYHHPIEAEHPDWMQDGIDVEANLQSRAAFVPRALEEDAWLIATHISGIGRLRRTAQGAAWEAV